MKKLMKKNVSSFETVEKYDACTGVKNCTCLKFWEKDAHYNTNDHEWEMVHQRLT